MFLTAQALLAIVEPEALFPGELAAAKRRYRQLSAEWHPDRGGDAAVFAHVAALYRTAVERLNNGQWRGPSLIRLRDTSGYDQTIQTRAGVPFQFGHVLLADDSVCYCFEDGHIARFEAARTRTFRFANPHMEQECGRYLPIKTHAGVLVSGPGTYLWQVYKTPDLLRLRDILARGRLEPATVAWIVSSLMNLCCYLAYANIVHHDISPDTYFVSPKHHTGALLGGWWAARTRGTHIAEVPARTFAVMPFSAKRDRLARSATDLALVRLTARECLAGPAPGPMQAWLTSVGTGSAADQYGQWRDILVRTFGPRRFVHMNVTADEVYGQEAAYGIR